MAGGPCVSFVLFLALIPTCLLPDIASVKQNAATAGVGAGRGGPGNGMQKNAMQWDGLQKNATGRKHKNGPQKFCRSHNFVVWGAWAMPFCQSFFLDLNSHLPPPDYLARIFMA